MYKMYLSSQNNVFYCFKTEKGLGYNILVQDTVCLSTDIQTKRLEQESCYTIIVICVDSVIVLRYQMTPKSHNSDIIRVPLGSLDYHAI